MSKLCVLYCNKCAHCSKKFINKMLVNCYLFTVTSTKSEVSGVIWDRLFKVGACPKLNLGMEIGMNYFLIHSVSICMLVKRKHCEYGTNLSGSKSLDIIITVVVSRSLLRDSCTRVYILCRCLVLDIHSKRLARRCKCHKCFCLRILIES